MLAKNNIQRHTKYKTINITRLCLILALEERMGKLNDVNKLGHNCLGDDITWHHITAMTSQITDNCIVCSIVSSDAHQRKHQTSASLVIMGESTGNQWIPLTKGQ